MSLYVYVQRFDFFCICTMITKTITPTVKFYRWCRKSLEKHMHGTGCLPSDHQLQQNPSLVSTMPMIKTTHTLMQMLEEKKWGTKVVHRIYVYIYIDGYRYMWWFSHPFMFEPWYMIANINTSLIKHTSSRLKLSMLIIHATLEPGEKNPPKTSMLGTLDTPTRGPAPPWKITNPIRKKDGWNPWFSQTNMWPKHSWKTDGCQPTYVSQADSVTKHQQFLSLPTIAMVTPLDLGRLWVGLWWTNLNRSYIFSRKMSGTGKGVMNSKQYRSTV